MTDYRKLADKLAQSFVLSDMTLSHRIEKALNQVRREALEEIADELAFKFENQIGPINAVIAWIRLWAKDPGASVRNNEKTS